MKQLFSDIAGFMTDLNHVDLLLYFAILILIILVVSLIYIIKNSDNDTEMTEMIEETTKDEVDLNDIVTNIQNNEPSAIEFTSYEKDQEEKAIISYDELLEKNKQGKIVYDEEKISDDEVSIKKIDLDKIIKENMEEKKEQTESKLFQYTNEEAFLKALNALNELLN